MSDPTSHPLAKSSAQNLASYSFLGASLGLLPLPWLPEYAAKRVRGTLVHELAARRGLSVTPKAREILAAPFTVGGSMGKWLAPVLRFGVGRLASKLTPLSAAAPILSLGSTYLLGHLLGRWLDGPRPVGTSRIDVAEAIRVRKAIDGALLHALRHLEQSPTSPWKDLPRAPEELREATDTFVDGFVMALANVPPWLLVRIEEGFDAQMLEGAP